MDGLGDLINQAVASASTATQRDPGEQNRRKAAIGALFVAKGRFDGTRAAIYLESTWEIPVFFLEAAATVILRGHKWPDVPQVADIWTVAREIAGMNRQQYRAGHYVPYAREWPVAGERHGIEVGTREKLPMGLLPAIPAGILAQIEAGGGRNGR